LRQSKVWAQIKFNIIAQQIYSTQHNPIHSLPRINNFSNDDDDDDDDDDDEKCKRQT